MENLRRNLGEEASNSSQESTKEGVTSKPPENVGSRKLMKSRKVPRGIKLLHKGMRCGGRVGSDNSVRPQEIKEAGRKDPWPLALTTKNGFDYPDYDAS